MYTTLTREERHVRREKLKRLAEIELQFLIALHDIGGTDIEEDSHHFASPYLRKAYQRMQDASMYVGAHLYSVIDARPEASKDVEDDDAAAA